MPMGKLISAVIQMMMMMIPHKTTFGLSNSLYNNHGIKSNWENHY